jgi:hypothetical protein
MEDSLQKLNCSLDDALESLHSNAPALLVEKQAAKIELKQEAVMREKTTHEPWVFSKKKIAFDALHKAFLGPARLRSSMKHFFKKTRDKTAGQFLDFTAYLHPAMLHGILQVRFVFIFVVVVHFNILIYKRTPGAAGQGLNVLMQYIHSICIIILYNIFIVFEVRATNCVEYCALHTLYTSCIVRGLICMLRYFICSGQARSPAVADTIHGLCDLLSDLTRYSPDPLLLLPDSVTDLGDGDGLRNTARSRLLERLLAVENGLPETNKSWVLHGIIHVIDCIQIWNSCRETWCMYGERFMRYVKSLTRNFRHCEASILSALRRSTRALVGQAIFSAEDRMIRWNISTNPSYWEGNLSAPTLFERQTVRSQLKRSSIAPVESPTFVNTCTASVSVYVYRGVQVLLRALSEHYSNSIPSYSSFLPSLRAQYRDGNLSPTAEDMGVDEADMRFLNPCSQSVTTFRSAYISGWLFSAGEYERHGTRKPLSWFASTGKLIGLVRGHPDDAVFVRILHVFKHQFHDGIARSLLGVAVVARNSVIQTPSGHEILTVHPSKFQGQLSVVLPEAVLCPVSFLCVTHLGQPGFMVIRRGIKA